MLWPKLAPLWPGAFCALLGPAVARAACAPARAGASGGAGGAPRTPRAHRSISRRKPRLPLTHACAPSHDNNTPPAQITKYVEREILNHRCLVHPHIVQFKEVRCARARARSWRRRRVAAVFAHTHTHTPTNAPDTHTHPTQPKKSKVFLTPVYLGIAMEFASGGDMFEYVVKKNGLREDEARWFYQQLIVGLDYCHRMVCERAWRGGVCVCVLAPAALCFFSAAAAAASPPPLKRRPTTHVTAHTAPTHTPRTNTTTNHRHTLHYTTPHYQGVVNRDIKLENTLLDSSPRPLVKICDFGYSKRENFQSAPGSRVGTPAYLAPEVILTTRGKTYDGKVRCAGVR